MSTENRWLRGRVRHIAEQMRRDAEQRKYVNPSHLCGYADELEHALQTVKEIEENRTVTVPVVSMGQGVKQ